MRGAWGWWMDAILFGMKRGHQAALRFEHGVLAPFGLTPARFDMLYALGQRLSVRQSELRRELGVARSTVSRMLASLERLGWVERTPREHTRRIRLTPAGVALLRRAAWRVCGRRRLPFRMVAQAFRGVRPKSRDFVARGEAEGLLWRFRRTFGDHARLDYPWYEDH
jgi:DNA-binding MarR family transcriptional regulator